LKPKAKHGERRKSPEVFEGNQSLRTAEVPGKPLHRKMEEPEGPEATSSEKRSARISNGEPEIQL